MFNLNTTDKLIRNSNLELLRILSMLFIVSLHLIIQDSRIASIHNKPILMLLYFFSGTGVSCFALLSGYFGIKPSYRKSFNLWFDTRFYFLMGNVILFAKYTPDIKLLYRCFGPANVGYWYIVAYILLSIVICNFGDLSDDKVRNKKFLIFLLAFYFCGQWFAFSIGTEFSLVLICYLIGRMIRYGNIKLCLKWLFFISFIGALIHNLSGYFELEYLHRLMNTNYSPFTLSTSLFIFGSFLRMPSFKNKYINKFAAASLGVYLLTEVSVISDFVHSYLICFSYSALSILVFAVISYTVAGILFIITSPIVKYLSNFIFDTICNSLKTYLFYER